jgi:hypothetical protein
MHMRSMRQRLATATVLSGLVMISVGFVAGPAGASVESNCQAILGQAQSGSLSLTGSPAAGSDVPMASTIDLSGSWNQDDYQETDRFYVCATVDGTYDEALSSEERPLDNDGSYSTSAALPSSVPAGSDVCFTGAVRGQLTSGVTGVDMVSETLCYRVAAAATTTTTTTAPVVEPPVVEPAVVEAGSPAAPAVEAAPAPVEEPASLPVLPRTGAGIELLTGMGGLALAAGGIARFFGRRR